MTETTKEERVERVAAALRTMIYTGAREPVRRGAMLWMPWESKRPAVIRDELAAEDTLCGLEPILSTVSAGDDFEAYDELVRKRCRR